MYKLLYNSFSDELYLASCMCLKQVVCLTWFCLLDYSPQTLRDLLNMAFKMFNEKVSHSGQKCQLLAGTLWSPKKTDGA